MRRIHAANAPGYSPALNAWLHPSLHPDAAKPAPSRGDIPSEGTGSGPKAQLRISDAQVGGNFWPTLLEQQQYGQRLRADLEQQRADAERLRADLEQQRADAERLRADLEQQRADAAERGRAEAAGELEELRLRLAALSAK
jgi:hypothetical protein